MKEEFGLEEQRKFFAGGLTRTAEFRLGALEKLRQEIIRREDEILAALEKDLGKCPGEAYAAEVAMVLEEIRDQKKHLRRRMAPRMVPASAAQLPGMGWVAPEPLGCVLVLSPWNYPFQLALSPAVGAIAAGNCVTIKPSRRSPAVARVLEELIAACFPPDYVQVLPAGLETNRKILECRFDHIFFTGGVETGRKVMEAAARHLTPVTLELGGKSPCIVDETAHIPSAARRIAWGKWLNSGQTCVAPDYVLVHSSVYWQLVRELRKAVIRLYTGAPCANAQYPRIVSEEHWDRLKGLLEGQKLLYDAGEDRALLKMGPKLVENPAWNSPLMTQEIFGPILPIIPYDSLDRVIARLRRRPKPLALYLFTRCEMNRRKVWGNLSFGGGCVNDTVIHLASTRLPFGGVGESGMGAYHGKASFDVFSHYRSTLWKPSSMELPLRYPPYTPRSLAWMRRLFEGK